MNIEDKIKSYFKGKDICAIQKGNVNKLMKANEECRNYIQGILEKTPEYLNPVYVVHHILFGEELPRCKGCGKLLDWKHRKSEYCSKKCVWIDVSTEAKRKATVKEKYGSEYFCQTESFKEERKKTLVEHYGVDCPLKSEKVLARARETNRKKYGVDYYFQTESFKEERKKTWLSKYGVDTAMKSDEVKSKRNMTNVERYGHPSFQTKQRWNTIVEKWKDYVLPLFNEEDLEAGEDKEYRWKCAKCGREFTQRIYNTSHLTAEAGEQVPRCLSCFPMDLPYSRGEKEVLEFCKSCLPEGTEVLENTRDIISPYEIDIYVPSLKLGIEYDGDYWHSKCPSGYHEKKDQMARDLGIKLVHVKECDWKSQKCKAEEELSKLLSNK